MKKLCILVLIKKYFNDFVATLQKTKMLINNKSALLSGWQANLSRESNINSTAIEIWVVSQFFVLQLYTIKKQKTPWLTWKKVNFKICFSTNPWNFNKISIVVNLIRVHLSWHFLSSTFVLFTSSLSLYSCSWKRTVHSTPLNIHIIAYVLSPDG